MTTPIVNFGIDSLWLNFRFPALEDEDEEGREQQEGCVRAVFARLTPQQEQARERDEPVESDGVFRQRALDIYPHGGGARSPWRFLLRNDDLEVKIGTGKKTGYVAKVRLAASYLWSMQLQDWCSLTDAIAEVTVWVSALFGMELEPCVGEVHLCADVVANFARVDWQQAFIRRSGFTPHYDGVMAFVSDGEQAETGLSQQVMIARLKEQVRSLQQQVAQLQAGEETIIQQGPDRVHMRYRPITGYSFGTHASAISAVLYNKSDYITTKEPDSDYFHAIWTANGWDGVSEVWRMEFRLKRGCLRELKREEQFHGLDDALLLSDCLESIWQYCTTHWLRYVVPSEDSNRARWETHPVWQDIQCAYRPMARVDLAPIVRERKYVVNVARMVPQIVGCLLTLYAWLKQDQPCEGEELSMVLHWLYPEGVDYLDTKRKDFNELVQKRQRQYKLLPALPAAA